jgi:hypothetical protein
VADTGMIGFKKVLEMLRAEGIQVLVCFNMALPTFS